jgi:hypothetical protein
VLISFSGKTVESDSEQQICSLMKTIREQKRNQKKESRITEEKHQKIEVQVLIFIIIQQTLYMYIFGNLQLITHRTPPVCQLKENSSYSCILHIECDWHHGAWRTGIIYNYITFY